MKPEIAQRLIELNRKFYTDFGESFSATRGRIQPGVRRIIESLDGDETVLDLGCGNGELARALARNGHRGAYLGLDFSLPLLADAESVPEGFPAQFREVDLTSDWSVIASARRPSAPRGRRPETGERGNPLFMRGLLRRSAPRNDTFDVVFSFAVLHHIPSQSLRLNILKSIHELLAEGGRFIHSNWQFLNSPRLRGRLRKWSEAGFSESDLDENDYLLDWRSGGTGLRYVHLFSEAELAELAGASGFEILETFYSDGREGDLGIYQIWRRSV
jgi:SAM-dependent methyltransferase